MSDHPTLRSAATELREAVAGHIAGQPFIEHLDITVDVTLGLANTPAGATIVATIVATSRSPLLGQRIITAIIVPPNTTPATAGDTLLRQVAEEYDRTMNQATT